MLVEVPLTHAPKKSQQPAQLEGRHAVQTPSRQVSFEPHATHCWPAFPQERSLSPTLQNGSLQQPEQAPQVDGLQTPREHSPLQGEQSRPLAPHAPAD